MPKLTLIKEPHLPNNLRAQYIVKWNMYGVQHNPRLACFMTLTRAFEFMLLLAKDTPTRKLPVKHLASDYDNCPWFSKNLDIEAQEYN